METASQPIEPTALELNTIESQGLDQISEAELKDAVSSLDIEKVFFDEVGSLPLLTAAQEVSLAKRIEQGDELAKEELIVHNIKLVVSVASDHLRQGLPLLDLVQEGSIGLMRAAEKFDWRRGNKFSTYAYWWISQSIKRAIANKAHIIRVPVNVSARQGNIRKVTESLTAELGREPTVDELIERTGMRPVHLLAAISAPVANVSLDNTVGGHEDSSTLHQLISDGTDVEYDIVEGSYAKRVRQVVDNLPPREFKIIMERFGFDGDPQALEAIGKELGITRERVRQLEEQALGRMAIALSRGTLTAPAPPKKKRSA